MSVEGVGVAGGPALIAAIGRRGPVRLGAPARPSKLIDNTACYDKSQPHVLENEFHREKEKHRHDS